MQSPVHAIQNRPGHRVEQIAVNHVRQLIAKQRPADRNRAGSGQRVTWSTLRKSREVETGRRLMERRRPQTACSSPGRGPLVQPFPVSVGKAAALPPDTARRSRQADSSFRPDVPASRATMPRRTGQILGDVELARQRGQVLRIDCSRSSGCSGSAATALPGSLRSVPPSDLPPPQRRSNGVHDRWSPDEGAGTPTPSASGMTEATTSVPRPTPGP